MSGYEIVSAESVDWLGRGGGKLGVTDALRNLRQGEALKLPNESRKTAYQRAKDAGVRVQTTVIGEFCYVRLLPKEAQP